MRHRSSQMKTSRPKTGQTARSTNSSSPLAVGSVLLNDVGLLDYPTWVILIIIENHSSTPSPSAASRYSTTTSISVGSRSPELSMKTRTKPRKSTATNRPHVRSCRTLSRTRVQRRVFTRLITSTKHNSRLSKRIFGGRQPSDGVERVEVIVKPIEIFDVVPFHVGGDSCITERKCLVGLE